MFVLHGLTYPYAFTLLYRAILIAIVSTLCLLQCARAQQTESTAVESGGHTVYLHLFRSSSGSLMYRLTEQPSINDEDQTITDRSINILWETIRSRPVSILLQIQTSVPSLVSTANIINQWNMTQIARDTTVHTVATTSTITQNGNTSTVLTYTTSEPQISLETFISEQSRMAGLTVDRAFPHGSPFTVLCNETLSIATVNSTNCTASVLRIQFGPTPNFRMWRLSTDTDISIPLSWLNYYTPITVSVRGQTELATIDLPIYFSTNIPSSIRQNTVFALCCAIGVGSIVTGGGGWVGLTSLQTLLVSVGGNQHCAEPFTDYYFRGLYDVLVAPTAMVDPSIEYGQILTVGIILFCLFAHGIAASVKAKLSRAGFWAAARWCYFPMPFLISVTYLWIQLSAQTFNGVVVSDKSPLTQVSFALSWLLVVVVTAYVWYDALSTGHDGYYMLTPLPPVLRKSENDATTNPSNRGKEVKYRSSGPPNIGGTRGDTQGVLPASPYVKGLYKVFGGVAWLFIPEGSWPLTRGFGVCRGLFRDSTCSFATFTLIFLCVIASVSNSASCSALFINTATVQCIYLAISLLYRPFRIPILNIVWVTIKCLEITVNICLNHFLQSNYDGGVTDVIPAMATVIIGLNAFFVFYACIVTFLERSARNRERLVKIIRNRNTLQSQYSVDGVKELDVHPKDDPEYQRLLASYMEMLALKCQ